jgi:hypothetical protein
MVEADSGAPAPRRDHKRLALACVGIISFAVFARTAYPTITWWDSSSYSLAAVTLGITTPPGSLLLTVVGWIITRVPTGLPPAGVLNLLAGMLAVVTVTLVFRIAVRLLRYAEDAEAVGVDRSPGAAVVGAACGALTFAFSETLWQYAVQFTPFVLTSVFTGLLLWTMLRWWERAAHRDSWRWLLVLGLLFGLDFSVHRTNLLLLPVLLVWILLRHPRTLGSARAWISGAGGMIVGLAFHLLIIPIAGAGPAVNAGDPSNWSRFYEYVSLAQYGGGWLVQFYPRHAPLWSVQVMDLIRAFGANFLWIAGRIGIQGILPGLFGLLGLLSLWHHNRRLAVAFVALLLVHAAVTVAYFNIPAHFFRSLDRHYLPVFVTWAVLVAYGMGRSLDRLRDLSWSRRWHWGVAASGLLALAPVAQLIRNWRAIDGSPRFFTEDYASNALNGLPKNAILFTAGDNDTWPLVYVHVVHHLRPDVQIVNLSLANTVWYVDQIVRSDPSFPLSRGETDSLTDRPWTDTTLMIPVVGSSAAFGLPEDLVLPDSIAVDVTPTFGSYMTRGDLVLLHILENNRWQRPLCLSTTLGEQYLVWLNPYRRLDGLFWRIVPHAAPPASREILRRNLLETYAYRGYAEPDLPLDDVSRTLGPMYYRPLITLAHLDYDHGERDRCRATRETVFRALPLSRLQPDSTLSRLLEGLCELPRATTPVDPARLR